MMNYGMNTYAMPYSQTGTGYSNPYSSYGSNQMGYSNPFSSYGSNQMSMYNQNNYANYNYSPLNMYQQNNYQQNNSMNLYQNSYPQYNAYSSNYSNSNSGNTYYISNIYNNMMGQTGYQQQPIMQGQMFGQNYSSPMMMQGQMFNTGSSYPSLMQGQIFNQQPVAQQSGFDMSGMMQMLLSMLLPLLAGTPVAYDDEQVTIDDGSSIWGDPHYKTKGSDGKTDINFTHAGEADHIYDVFNGDGYEVDAKYVNWGGAAAKVMGETNIKAGADKINFKQDGSLSINGTKIEDGKSVTLNDGTKVSLKGKIATIESRDGDGAKINMDASGGYINVDPTGKFSKLGGILGKAISENKNLTEEECEKFDLTDNKKA